MAEIEPGTWCDHPTGECLYSAELAALRKDAERYRWLRANTHGEQDGRGRQEFCMPDPCPRANIMRGSVAQHLDAAIDADMLEAEAVRKAIGAA